LTSTEQLLGWLGDLDRSAALRDVTVGRPEHRLIWAARRGLVAVLAGETEVEGHAVRVRIGLTPSFPNELPYIQFAGADGDFADGLTAHVASDNDICYTPSRDMVFDPGQPMQILTDALARALEALAESWTEPGNPYLDEFTLYWSPRVRPGQRPLILRSHFTPDDHLRPLAMWREADTEAGRRSAWTRKRGQQQRLTPAVAVAEQGEAGLQALREFNQLARDPFVQPSGSALYLPLQPTPELLPPAPGSRWSPAELRDIVRASLTPQHLDQLDALLERRLGGEDLLVLGVPRPRRSGVGRYGLVAVQLGGMRRRHALLLDAELHTVRLTALMVTRRDRDLIMQRGGSDTTLSRRRVLLLGCGALGGHLAFALASAGVGDLTLVDHDTFSIDNTFRHVLGRRFMGQPKVSAMTQALHERYPYLTVDPRQERTDRLVEQGDLALEDFDLVVDATGSTTHHLTLAGLLAPLPPDRRPAVLVTWLEAMGLGGHTLTVLPGGAGCPRCLYSHPEAPLFNVASFSAPGQDLGSDALGCGSYHTPFSDLDAMRTAEAAARTAVSVLRGDEKGSLLRSWRGDERAFVAAGHRVSRRFLHEQDRHLSRGVGYAQPGCPQCGGRP